MIGGVDLAQLASSTPGMVGADLRNLVNEAALGAARRSVDGVGRADFAEALEKILLGTARRILLSPDDRRLIAYHESGQALLGMLEPGADPVRKVSIIPRGNALGVTFQSRTRTTTGTAPRSAAGSPARSAAAPRSTWCSATSPPVPSPTSSRPPPWPGRWSVAGACPSASDWCRCSPAPARREWSSGFRRRCLRAHTGARRRRGPPHHRAHALEVLGEHREQLDGLAETLLVHEPLDEADACRAAGLPARQTA
jgi:cell division protease FtsH